MKYCVIIIDALSDRTYFRFRNRTPLEVARTPSMDDVAKNGRIGLVKNSPQNFPDESLVDILSVCKKETKMYYTGIAGFEAKTLGIELEPNDWAFCCDFVSTFEGKLVDPTAGKIREQEAELLIKELEEYFAKEPLKFYKIKNSHHLVVFKDIDFSEIITVNPYDISGHSIEKHYPKGDGHKLLVDIMQRAKKMLLEHEINKIRLELQENPADSIWLWGAGKIPLTPDFNELFGLKGSIITASPGVKGFAKGIDLDIIDVPNINGSWNTNYEGKRDHALQALSNSDIVFVHIGALMDLTRSDNVTQKIRILEQIDKKIIGPLYKKLDDNLRMMVVEGHFINKEDDGQNKSFVPFAIHGGNFPGGTDLEFNEKNARKVDFYIKQGYELLPFFLKK